MILKTWKDAIAEIDRAYYNYKSIVKLNRDGVAVVERINSHSIINKRMSNYHKTMGFNKFQVSVCELLTKVRILFLQCYGKPNFSFV